MLTAAMINRFFFILLNLLPGKIKTSLCAPRTTLMIAHSAIGVKEFLFPFRRHYPIESPGPICYNTPNHAENKGKGEK